MYHQGLEMRGSSSFQAIYLTEVNGNTGKQNSINNQANRQN